MKVSNVLGLLVALSCLGVTLVMGLWAVSPSILHSSDTVSAPAITPQWMPPEQFQLTQTKSPYGKSKQVGIRWVPPVDVQCAGYMQEGCYQLEIVSEQGCNSLYVSLVRLDSAGVNIGYTNDTASSVAAGQIARLSFSSKGEDSVQIGKISCF